MVYFCKTFAYLFKCSELKKGDIPRLLVSVTVSLSLR